MCGIVARQVIGCLSLLGIVRAYGQEGGRAVAEALFGDVNPSGHLPITFFRSTADLPAFTDYSMSNRTYRFFNGQPLFAFGHGLSYTKFAYNGAKIDRDTVGPAGSVRLAVKVENSGSRDGEGEEWAASAHHEQDHCRSVG